MMIYCLCTKAGGHPKNGYREFNAGGKHSAVEIHVPMKVVEVGAVQVLSDDQGGMHQHYPNVDILECPNCGAQVVREK